LGLFKYSLSYPKRTPLLPNQTKQPKTNIKPTQINKLEKEKEKRRQGIEKPKKTKTGPRIRTRPTKANNSSNYFTKKENRNRQK